MADRVTAVLARAVTAEARVMVGLVVAEARVTAAVRAIPEEIDPVAVAKVRLR